MLRLYSLLFIVFGFEFIFIIFLSVRLSLFWYVECGVFIRYVLFFYMSILFKLLVFWFRSYFLALIFNSSWVLASFLLIFYGYYLIKYLSFGWVSRNLLRVKCSRCWRRKCNCFINFRVMWGVLVFSGGYWFLGVF